MRRMKRSGPTRPNKKTGLKIRTGSIPVRRTTTRDTARTIRGLLRAADKPILDMRGRRATLQRAGAPDRTHSVLHRGPIAGRTGPNLHRLLARALAERAAVRSENRQILPIRVQKLPLHQIPWHARARRSNTVRRGGGTDTIESGRAEKGIRLPYIYRS